MLSSSAVQASYYCLNLPKVPSFLALRLTKGSALGSHRSISFSFIILPLAALPPPLPRIPKPPLLSITDKVKIWKVRIRPNILSSHAGSKVLHLRTRLRTLTALTLLITIIHCGATLVPLRIRRLAASVLLVVATASCGRFEVRECVTVDAEGPLGVAGVGDGRGGYASKGAGEGLSRGGC